MHGALLSVHSHPGVWRPWELLYFPNSGPLPHPHPPPSFLIVSVPQYFHLFLASEQEERVACQ